MSIKLRHHLGIYLMCHKNAFFVPWDPLWASMGLPSGRLGSSSQLSQFIGSIDLIDFQSIGKAIDFNIRIATP